MKRVANPSAAKPSFHICDLIPEKGKDSYRSWARNFIDSHELYAQVLLSAYNDSHEPLPLDDTDSLFLRIAECIRLFREYKTAVTEASNAELRKAADNAVQAISNNGTRNVPSLLAMLANGDARINTDLHLVVYAFLDLLIDEIKSAAKEANIKAETTELRTVWKSSHPENRACTNQNAGEKIVTLFQSIATKIEALYNSDLILRGPEDIQRLDEIKLTVGGDYKQTLAKFTCERTRRRANADVRTFNTWDENCTTDNLDTSGKSKFGSIGKGKNTLLNGFSKSPTYITIANRDNFVEYSLGEKTYHIANRHAIAFIDLLIEANKNSDYGFVYKPGHITKAGKKERGDQLLNYCFRSTSKGRSPFKEKEFWHDHILKEYQDQSTGLIKSGPAKQVRLG